MWVNGDYRRGISVMDRHQAHAHETSKIAHAMVDWLNQLSLSASSFTPVCVPTSASGIGLTEAPRGALGHWLKIANRGSRCLSNLDADVLELLAARQRQCAWPA